MPQLLKGFIYLYNAGIKHADLHVGNVIVSKQFFGGLKTTIFDFDIIQELSPNRRLLDINTLSTMGSLGPSSPYACFDFQKAPTEFISLDVNLNMVKDPQNITSDERKAIAGHIIRNSGPAFSQSLTERKLEQVVNAYISLLRVTSISTQGNGCTSLVAALRSMSTPQQSSGNMFTWYFRKTPQQQPTQ
ncbi:hypothetical protein BDF22DRAFT_654315 [Syncephalis plumigaleata]|nr:hypothetical protein BDF22DRAFT_654315 [Syncephalis plumigaleata]